MGTRPTRCRARTTRCRATPTPTASLLVLNRRGTGGGPACGRRARGRRRRPSPAWSAAGLGDAPRPSRRRRLRSRKLRRASAPPPARRPPTYAKSSGTNGAIAIIGAKRMRVIVRDGNGVPIEPPTSTGGEASDDFFCASVDESCLDGLLPHGGGARVDPYRARDALRRRGGCGGKLSECAEYRCAACGDEYRKRCGLNPWWALVQHECPRCGRVQFPSINIAAAANAITYLAADDDAADHRAARAAADALALQDAHDDAALLPDLGLDPREGAPPLNDDEKPSWSWLVVATRRNASRRRRPRLATSVVSPPATVKGRGVGRGERGFSCVRRRLRLAGGRERPLPAAEAASRAAEAGATVPAGRGRQRLFALFDHARYCPGCHKSKKHDDVCAAAKFVMLHVRDCAGHLPDGRPCPFGWCSAARLAIRKHHLPPILDK